MNLRSPLSNLNAAHVRALSTAHVLCLNKADVLALNKAHVLLLINKTCPIIRANAKPRKGAGGQRRLGPFGRRLGQSQSHSKPIQTRRLGPPPQKGICT